MSSTANSRSERFSQVAVELLQFVGLSKAMLNTLMSAIQMVPAVGPFAKLADLKGKSADLDTFLAGVPDDKIVEWVEQAKQRLDWVLEGDHENQGQ